MSGGAAFVLIRYGISRHQSAKNSLTKWLSVHNNYTGTVAGVSDTIQCLEGHWSHDKGVAVISFESLDDAVRWTHSTPEIKQHDWLDGVDMLVVPVNELPKQGFRYVQILDISFRDYDMFVEKYAKDVQPYLQELGASGAVVATSKVKKIKGLWDPNYLVINFWGSAEQFEESYNSEKYGQMRDVRQCYSDTDMCIFEMENLLHSCH